MRRRTSRRPLRRELPRIALDAPSWRLPVLLDPLEEAAVVVERDLPVASADDDLWPLRVVLGYGVTVLHTNICAGIRFRPVGRVSSHSWRLEAWCRCPWRGSNTRGTGRSSGRSFLTRRRACATWSGSGGRTAFGVRGALTGRRGGPSEGFFVCTACELQTSVTAGTLLAGTRTPLVSWCMSICS